MRLSWGCSRDCDVGGVSVLLDGGGTVEEGGWVSVEIGSGVKEKEIPAEWMREKKTKRLRVSGPEVRWIF